MKTPSDKKKKKHCLKFIFQISTSRHKIRDNSDSGGVVVILWVVLENKIYKIMTTNTNKNKTSISASNIYEVKTEGIHT